MTYISGHISVVLEFFRRIFFEVVLLCLCLPVLSNNIKIDGKAKILEFVGADTAVVEFTVSWENSWRDAYNWDAAWVFLKYRKRGEAEAWQHAYLASSGHQVVGNGMELATGETGAATPKVMGVFLTRSQGSEGNVNARLRIKWPVKSNAGLPLSAADFGKALDSIYVSAYAVEMVYVPNGAYYLGDQSLANSFKTLNRRIIPPEADLIGTGDFTYSGSPYPYYTPAEGAANRVNDAVWHSPYTHIFHITTGTHGDAALNNVSWTVDFKTTKTIRTFGVSGSTHGADYGPIARWHLLGSNDQAVWDTLWSGGREHYIIDPVSYPVQHALRVKAPGAYRYYRLFFPKVGGTGILLANAAMSEKDLFPDATDARLVENEDKIVQGKGVGQLYTDDGTAFTGEIAAVYPKGYSGFYCMKYEVSQEQYVDFLNALTLSQQKNRVANGDFDRMLPGDYVFGSLKRPNNRNGIVLMTKRAGAVPAVFGNNLTADKVFFADNDGQTLPCNYLNPLDMLAYCDWAGLRPMSEMEYEKACRRLHPQLPEQGEFVWNFAMGANRVLSDSEIRNGGTEREVLADYRKNVNNGGRLNGPVRSGAFATSQTNQLEAGATCWGIMEMGGNLSEMCYNAGAAGKVFRTDHADYAHGDGSIADAGTDIPAAYWPIAKEAFALRGGSFSSSDALLRTSERSAATGSYFTVPTHRDSTVGFRAVRSVKKNAVFSAKDIFMPNSLLQDTVCAGEICIVKGGAVRGGVGKVTYIWYSSADNGATWQIAGNAGGADLAYGPADNDAAAAKILKFKRKAFCATGDDMSGVVTLVINPGIPTPVVEQNIKAGLGYPFELPCDAGAGLSCKWTFPDGRTGSSIVDFTGADNGTYRLCHVDQAGCRSETVAVNVTGVNAIPIKDYGAYRGWADGTFAKSANEYRNPEPPYLYMGATGDGVYRIDPDGAGSLEPKEVYCNMANAGGGWMMIVNSIAGTSVSTLCTAGEYNAAAFGDRTKSYKLADSWVNKVSYTAYWTEGKNTFGIISHSYWKKSECTNGGIFATPNTTTSCYIRYDNAATTLGRHQGLHARNMFDDDRGNDAWFIWPYLSNTVVVDWGHTGSYYSGVGEYRIWVR